MTHDPRHPDRPRLDDRKALCGILFVPHTGISWEHLPQKPGFGSGMIGWRRLRDWNEAGVWQRLHENLLAGRRGVGPVEGGGGRFPRAGDEGRPTTGPSPVDRARTGSTHHLITEAHGIPLHVSLTGGNRHDATPLMPVIQAVPPVRGRRGLPRPCPETLYADRAYDYDTYRKRVPAVGIRPVIVRRGTAHGSGLGTYRWAVEQGFALLHWLRRLRLRWEVRDDIHEAFLLLACGIICLRRLLTPQLCAKFWVGQG